MTTGRGIAQREMVKTHESATGDYSQRGRHTDNTPYRMYLMLTIAVRAITDCMAKLHYKLVMTEH